MKKMKDKVRKRKVNWRNVMFGLHRPSLTEDFNDFVVKHPKMSKNRCAYYVLRKNYSITLVKEWRYQILYGLGDEYNISSDLQKIINHDWIHSL